MLLQVNSFVPLAPFLLHLFKGTDAFLERKTKHLQDGMPNMNAAVRISKTQINSTDMKDWIFNRLV